MVRKQDHLLFPLDSRKQIWNRLPVFKLKSSRGHQTTKIGRWSFTRICWYVKRDWKSDRKYNRTSLNQGWKLLENARKKIIYK